MATLTANEILKVKSFVVHIYRDFEKKRSAYYDLFPFLPDYLKLTLKVFHRSKLGYSDDSIFSELADNHWNYNRTEVNKILIICRKKCN